MRTRHRPGSRPGRHTTTVLARRGERRAGDAWERARRGAVRARASPRARARRREQRTRWLRGEPPDWRARNSLPQAANASGWAPRRNTHRLAFGCQSGARLYHATPVRAWRNSCRPCSMPSVLRPPPAIRRREQGCRRSAPEPWQPPRCAGAATSSHPGSCTGESLSNETDGRVCHCIDAVHGSGQSDTYR